MQNSGRTRVRPECVKCLQMCGERLWFRSSFCRSCSVSEVRQSDTESLRRDAIHRKAALSQATTHGVCTGAMDACRRLLRCGGVRTGEGMGDMHMRCGRRRQSNCAASWVAVTLLARQPIGCKLLQLPPRSQWEAPLPSSDVQMKRG